MASSIIAKTATSTGSLIGGRTRLKSFVVRSASSGSPAAVFRSGGGSGTTLLTMTFVAGDDTQITIPEHGKVVKFSPVEKAVYSLFLCIDEGIKYVDIGDYRGKLKDLYGTYYNRSSVAEIDQVVESLCNILEPGRLREAVSKCNKKIKEALGDDFSDQYQIKGPRGGAKRIKLDRSLVKHLEGYEF